MKTKFAITLFFTFLLSFSSWAGEVTQVKGKSLMLKLDGESVSEGDKLYLLNSSGKKSALIQIKKVKGDKALADLVKGKASTGMTTQSMGKTSKGKKAQAGEESYSYSGSQTYAGITAGYNMDSMSLTAVSGSSSEALSLSGSSFSIKGFYDYPLMSWMTARVGAGLESFVGAASPSNPNVCTGTCTVNYQYLALEGHAQFHITPRPNRFWVGAGYAYLMGMSASSSVKNLDTSSKSNYMMVFSGGYDYALSGGSFIPISFEYGSFPGTDVKATAMSLKAGYGMKF